MAATAHSSPHSSQRPVAISRAPQGSFLAFLPEARSLIKPEPGTALAYLDFSSQEIAIAACLSNDDALWQAYASSDPYIQFAIDAGLAPEGATKESHKAERDACEVIMLGVQYGMSACGMGQKASLHVLEAKTSCSATGMSTTPSGNGQSRTVNAGLAGVETSHCLWLEDPCRQGTGC